MTAEGEALLRKPIRALLEVLDPAMFKQIHRSTIVDLKAIASIARDEMGRGLVRLQTRPETLSVSQPLMALFRHVRTVKNVSAVCWRAVFLVASDKLLFIPGLWCPDPKEVPMKSLIIAAALFAAAVPAMAQTNVSITVGQPNFYGRIDLGGYAPPPVYHTQPVIVERQVRYVGQPVYLRVPQGHRKHWNKNCYRYRACGQQVLFVQDGWYSNTYAPRYRVRHARGHGHPVVVHEQYRDGHRGRDHDRGHRGDERGHGRGHDRDGDRGHGRGNGHGNGHGKHGD